MGRPLTVLVTGAGGQLGREVALACEAAGDRVTAFDHATLDVARRDDVLGSVTMVRPDVVVHCAAWTAVDACESDPDRAFAVNGLGVRWMAEACRRSGAHLVHVSTDYVFSGTKTSPYTEWDDTGPLGVYGASKLAGEQEALAAGIGATVVRTSWVCGEHGPNMVKTVLRLLAGTEPLRFVDDQWGCPTFTASLAPMLRRLAVDRRPGLQHATNQGAVSWFEFVQAVVASAGGDVGRVEQIASGELLPVRPTRRPANGVLDNAVLRLSGEPLLPRFEEPLHQLVRQLMR